MAGSWFYVAEDGEEFGPISQQHLLRLAKSGEIQPLTLVWREGLAEWVEAREVKGLREHIFSRRTSSTQSGVIRDSSGKFCSNCGASLNRGAAVCLQCGAAVHDEGTQARVNDDRVYPSNPPKDPVLMALLSGCCIAGLGHMVLGQTIKGVMVLIGTVLFTLATWGAAAIVIWPLSGLDAFLLARKLKRGQSIGQWECF